MMPSGNLTLEVACTALDEIAKYRGRELLPHFLAFTSETLIRWELPFKKATLQTTSYLMFGVRRLSSIGVAECRRASANSPC